MRLLLITLLAITTSFISHASDSTRHNCINIVFRPKYYLNNKSITSDNREPNIMRTKNSLGYYGGIEYERITKQGLILNIGTHVGMQQYDIFIEKEMSQFDPNAYLEPYYQHINIPKIYYFDMGLMIGYQKRINDDWSITSKIGVFELNYLTEYLDIGDQYIMYLDKYGAGHLEPLFTYAVLFYKFRWEQRRFLRNINKLFEDPPDYEIYFGVERQLSSKFIKRISIGLVGSKKFNYGSIAYVTSIKSIHALQASNSYYTDKNTYIGLQLSVGLWK